MIAFEYLPTRNLCRLSGDEFEEIREFFSVKNKNAFFMKRFGKGFVNSRIYCITPTGLFEPGLFFEILKYIKNKTENVDITYDDKILSIVKPTISHSLDPFNRLSLELRDYQIETVKKAITFGRGIVKVGTGGGKTLTIASLISTCYIQNPKIKILVIVPDLTLVDQTFKDFINYKVPFTSTKWTGSLEPDLSSNVIIANIGILQSRFDENKWLVGVDMLIVDECHKLKKGNKVCKLITQIKTNHKFGLTGTLPDDKVDEWNIIGKLGTVFYEKTSYDLRLENYLTNADIKIIQLSYNDKPISNPQVNDFRNELNFIYNNEFRNEVIKGIVSKSKNNVLILINHLAHGDVLYSLLKDVKDKKTYYIKGEVEVEERAKVIKEMEESDNIVCIAVSAIFSTGVNIKNLHMIVFASGGKSFIRTIQSIGRGLRLNPNKDKLIIIDIADKLEYSQEHSQKRKEIYTQEKIQYKVYDIVEKRKL
jgi:superfamily II DNA or RNA helicase